MKIGEVMAKTSEGQAAGAGGSGEQSGSDQPPPEAGATDAEFKEKP